MTELSDIIQLPASDEEKERHIAKLERGGFSEEELETALMVAPDLFDPAPFFVGRQLPTDSGNSSRLRGRGRLAKQIPCLAAPL